MKITQQNKIFYRSILFFLILINITNAQKNLRVNKARLDNNLKKLSTFGMNKKGGNDRVAFSDFDIQARKYISSYLNNLGISTYTDDAGNLIAKRMGKKKKAKPIAFGSHIDAVPNGGHYDGDVGVIGGIEVLETLLENNIVTNHPLELIIFLY